MKKTAIKQFAIAIAIPVTLGALAAFLTRGNMNIYDDIVVPPLAPPMKLFPIAWTILYILMGIRSCHQTKRSCVRRFICLRHTAFFEFLLEHLLFQHENLSLRLHLATHVVDRGTRHDPEV